MIRRLLLAALIPISAFAQPGPETLPLMPWPATVQPANGNGAGVPITSGFSVALEGAGSSDTRVKDAALRFLIRVRRQTGVRTLARLAPSGQGATMVVRVEGKDQKGAQKLGDDESYSLVVNESTIRLSAGRPLGALRGMETVLQLVRQAPVQQGAATLGFTVTPVTISDSPRFPWRGLSLDVSRHFLPASDVRRTLDGMAAVKLNVLHWHLSDDQGFRVESKKFPRLHQLGSEGEYYTQNEVRDVIAYARDRGIRVVPEFDMPGHAKSWMPGYSKLSSGEGPYEIGNGFGILADIMDPTQESTYRFLDGFIGEMAKLFPDEYFHIGGDEVDPKPWEHNTRIRKFMAKKHLADAKALQTYFNARLLKIVTKHGKHMEGWDEILQPNLPKTIVIQSWRGQESLWQAATEGYGAILSAGYYLDLMQSAAQHYGIDPLVLPSNVKARLEKAGKPLPQQPGPEAQKNILGGEAAMWEELASSDNIDSRLWPRLAAIAERLWSPQGTTDVQSMYTRLEATNRWLEWLGLTQRTNLRLMRQRLAESDEATATLNTFASILEPVKGYSRHAQNYLTTTPLNRLVDAVPPESEEARHFNDEVNAFLAGGRAHPEGLAKSLARWSDAAIEIQPTLQSHALLLENIPVATAEIELCRYGQQALASGATMPDSGKTSALAAIDELAKRKGDLLIQIAPGVKRLVEAVPATASNGQ